jgi:hypothetical protein
VLCKPEKLPESVNTYLWCFGAPPLSRRSLICFLALYSVTVSKCVCYNSTLTYGRFSACRTLPACSLMHPRMVRQISRVVTDKQKTTTRNICRTRPTCSASKAHNVHPSSSQHGFPAMLSTCGTQTCSCTVTSQYTQSLEELNLHNPQTVVSADARYRRLTY